MLWEEAHKPAAWQDFIGNATQVQMCKDWLRSFQSLNIVGAETQPEVIPEIETIIASTIATASTKKPRKTTAKPPKVPKPKKESKIPLIPRVLILSGPNGCGKSLAADLLLRKQGYKVYSFGVREIKSHKTNKNALTNFCNLYLSDLSSRAMGAGGSRRQEHGIILEDFDGLNRADKKFNKAILDLIKKHPSSTVPLIITTTETNLTKQSGGLVKLSHVVQFQRLLQKDLVRIAQRIAQVQNLYMDNDQAELFAQNSHGDARQLISSLEMFYVGRNNLTRVDTAQIESYIGINGIESDEKICLSAPVTRPEGLAGLSQSDDERILGMAIGDRGDKYSATERNAATRLVMDTCDHFMPYLFQAYPGCLNPEKGSNMADVGIEIAAEVLEDLSVADLVHEMLWNHDSYYELFATLGLETPIKKLRACRKNDNRNFSVVTAGYEPFIGVENTMKTQHDIIMDIQYLNPSICCKEPGELGMIKELLTEIVNLPDREAVEAIYPVKPEYFEAFSRLKAGRVKDFVITKPRLKKMEKIYEELQEKNRPTVKYLEEHPVKQRKRVDPNDKFSLNFD